MNRNYFLVQWPDGTLTVSFRPRKCNFSRSFSPSAYSLRRIMQGKIVSSWDEKYLHCHIVQYVHETNEESL